jgi:hypothetical protein
MVSAAGSGMVVDCGSNEASAVPVDNDLFYRAGASVSETTSRLPTASA